MDRVISDLVWSYAEPQHDAEAVRDLLCFYQERVDLELDGAGAAEDAVVGRRLIRLLLEEVAVEPVRQ